MRALTITLLSLTLLFADCSNPSKQATPVANTSRKNIDIDLSWEEISMIKLIANPKEYEGRRVLVKGYLNLQFEADRLYFHKEDYENFITENSVRIPGRGSENWENIMKCNNHYVLIEGNFSELNGGTIENIGRVEKWENMNIPPKPKKDQVKFPPPN